MSGLSKQQGKLSRFFISTRIGILTRPHAWDTEAIDIDVKEKSPVGNGKIISAQVFLGPDVPFAKGPRLFIDNFGECKDLILEFKDYFEDRDTKKIWFNYGFDRHIFNNHGIDCKGFDGDVMHMARLLDPSLDPKQYSLKKLSINYEKELENFKGKYIAELERSFNGSHSVERSTLKRYKEVYSKVEAKTNMNTLFARQRTLKNGELGKTFEER